jgi:hypothetical protein
MSDPNLTKEIAEARGEADALGLMVVEMGRDLDAIEAADRIRGMALSKVRGDWAHLSQRVHALSNKFVELQERHMTVVEGPPPPAEPLSPPPIATEVYTRSECHFSYCPHETRCRASMASGGAACLFPAPPVVNKERP